MIEKEKIHLQPESIECSSKMEAKRHASFIAHRIGTEKPSFAKPGNCITVRDESGCAFFDVPITSTVRHL